MMLFTADEILVSKNFIIHLKWLLATRHSHLTRAYGWGTLGSNSNRLWASCGSQRELRQWSYSLRTRLCQATEIWYLSTRQSWHQLSTRDSWTRSEGCAALRHLRSQRQPILGSGPSQGWLQGRQECCGSPSLSQCRRNQALVARVVAQVYKVVIAITSIMICSWSSRVI